MYTFGGGAAVRERQLHDVVDQLGNLAVDRGVVVVLASAFLVPELHPRQSPRHSLTQVPEAPPAVERTEQPRATGQRRRWKNTLTGAAPSGRTRLVDVWRELGRR